MNNSVNFDKWICSLGNISLANQDIEHFSYQKVFCVISGSHSLQRQLFFWFLTLQISSAFSELSIHVIIEHVLSVSVSFTQLKISRCVHVVHEICSFLLLSISCMCGQLLQSCPTLCDPLDCSLPGSSVPGISQARILEWSAMPFFRDLLNPGIKPESPAWQADSSPTEPKTRQVLSHYVSCFFCSLRERTFGPATSSLDLLWIDLLWTFLYNSIWWQVFSFLLGKHQFPISSIWMFWLLRIFTNTW